MTEDAKNILNALPFRTVFLKSRLEMMYPVQRESGDVLRIFEGYSCCVGNERYSSFRVLEYFGKSEL
jgi:hypothetical protein